jgi:hypothetical protein
MIGCESGPLERIKDDIDDVLRNLELERWHLQGPSGNRTAYSTKKWEDGDDIGVLIVDIGSMLTRVGIVYANVDDVDRNLDPIDVFATMVGRPRHMGVMVGMGQKDSYGGDSVSTTKRSSEPPASGDATNRFVVFVVVLCLFCFCDSKIE